MDRVLQTKEAINKVSPSFCLAKWLQVSIHLQTGQTHSCHHPPVHPIPKEGLDQNPSILHNTPHKINERKQMLSGIRPEGCQYCWLVEDVGDHLISDRVLKSSMSWARPYINDVLTSPSETFVPSYIELSFSNICNFKCVYCNPQVSSSWAEEIKKWGAYPTSSQYNGQLLDESVENAIYRDAFWKWWPQISSKLKVLRLTGGEPLANEEVFRLLEYLLENPAPHLELGINSNLNPPQKNLQRFISIVQKLIDNSCIKSLKIYTSLESHGKDSEYIRYGIKPEIFEANVRQVLNAVPSAHLIFMSTLNLLSIPSYLNFLKWLKNLKVEFYSPMYTAESRILLDINSLKDPEMLSLGLADEKTIEPLKNAALWMQQVSDRTQNPDLSFHTFEIHKLNRAIEVAQSNNWSLEKKNTLLSDFFVFSQEIETRRRQNFLEFFPSLSELYQRSRAANKLKNGQK